MEDRKFFTSREAAAYVGYSYVWFKTLVYKGEVRSIQPGHDLLFERKELDALMKERGLSRNNDIVNSADAATFLDMTPQVFNWWRHHADEARRIKPLGGRGRRNSFSKTELAKWRIRVL